MTEPLTAAVAEAFHDALCTVSHHDRPEVYRAAMGQDQPCRVKFQRIADQALATARQSPSVDAPTAGELADWLDSWEGRIEDIFALWTQGVRSSRWVAEQLIDEGHLARLSPAPSASALSDDTPDQTLSKAESPAPAGEGADRAALLAHLERLVEEWHSRPQSDHRVLTEFLADALARPAPEAGDLRAAAERIQNYMEQHEDSLGPSWTYVGIARAALKESGS